MKDDYWEQISAGSEIKIGSRIGCSMCTFCSSLSSTTSGDDST